MKYTLFFYLVTAVNAAMTARGRVGTDNHGPRDSDNSGIGILLFFLWIISAFIYDAIRKKYFKPKVDLEKQKIKEDRRRERRKKMQGALDQGSRRYEFLNELLAVYPEFEFSTEEELESKIIANRYLFDTNAYTLWFKWRQHNKKKEIK